MAFDCLRKPPELCRRVARNSLSSRALTRAPASSLWTMATTSFTRGVSTAACDPGQRGIERRARSTARCTMRPPTTPDACRSPRVDRRPVPRSTHLAPAGHRGGRRARRPRCRAATASSTRGIAALRPAMGAIFIADPDRPRAPARRIGTALDEASSARLAAEVADPAHPFARRGRRPGRRPSIARRRRPTARRSSGRTCRSSCRAEASTCRSGRSASAGRRRTCSTTTERETLDALAALAAVAVDRAGWPRPPPSAPNGSSGWPTPTR